MMSFGTSRAGAGALSSTAERCARRGPGGNWSLGLCGVRGRRHGYEARRRLEAFGTRESRQSSRRRGGSRSSRRHSPPPPLNVSVGGSAPEIAMAVHLAEQVLEDTLFVGALLIMRHGLERVRDADAALRRLRDML